MKNLAWICVLVMVLSALTLSRAGFAAKIDNELGDNEVKIGREAAAEIAKESKLSDNAADLKRLREMGEKIAAVANKYEISALYGSPRVTPFDYQFNIIEAQDINAYSVPGGHIYVYRGLLEFVESDHELAGVLAHEIVHAAHHHMVFLLKKQATLNNQMAVVLLAAILGGAPSSDIGNVLMGAQLLQIAKLNGYGQEAERDADQGALYYMREAGYNPVGLLTFLERLSRKPELFDYGIYRSHPLDSDRIKAAKSLMEKLGIRINRRETTKAVSAEVRSEKVGDIEMPGVYILDKLIYRPAPFDGKSSEQRAAETAERINSMLNAGLKIHELRLDAANAGVIARGQALVAVSEADARLMRMKPSEVATAAATAIRGVLWKQLVDTVH